MRQDSGARTPPYGRARTARGGVAAPSASYRTAELWFDSVEDADACVRSNEGQAWMADFPNFATGGVTLLVTETD